MGPPDSRLPLKSGNCSLEIISHGKKEGRHRMRVKLESRNQRNFGDFLIAEDWP